MATPKQVAANRENAKRPRTISDETRESLRTRAVKHGLTATHEANTLLKAESKTEFESVRSALLADSTLGTAQELILIQLQADSYWKLRRANRMEAGALDASLLAGQMKDTISRDLQPDDLGAPLAQALREEAKWFDNLRRYATAAERSFYRATRELAMLRKAGPQEPIGRIPQEAPPEIGCDSQPPKPNPILQHPSAQLRPEFGGMTALGLTNKLETLPEDEAFALLDQLTAPPKH